MRPGPCGCFVTAGVTMPTGVSNSLKMRSLAAIADCRMLYFSLKSMIGRKKRMAYCVNAISTPREAAVATRWNEISECGLKETLTLRDTMPRITSCPPHQITQAIAIAEKKSTAG